LAFGELSRGCKNSILKSNDNCFFIEFPNHTGPRYKEFVFRGELAGGQAFGKRREHLT
jgi:hypothetical protein